MKTEQVLNSDFIRKIKDDGIDVQSMLGDAQEMPLPKAVVLWTGYKNDTIQAGIFKASRDVPLEKLTIAIRTVLAPWIRNESTEALPSIQVLQIARMTGIAPSQIANLLTKYPIHLEVGGRTLSLSVATPSLSKDPGLKDCKDIGISPKRILRQARFQSRPPGGGPVQKSGLQWQKIGDLVKKEGLERAQILLGSQSDEEITPEIGVMQSLSLAKTKRNVANIDGDIRKIAYAERNGKEIMNALNWFRAKGGKNWVLGGDENKTRFAQDLTTLSQNGQLVDFVIWNCIGFKWYPNTDGSFPNCEITDNLDAAITPFFKQRIQEVARVLANVGNPRITILVPSNEAFNPDIWPYAQSNDEREGVMSSAVTGLQKTFSSQDFPDNVSFEVKRWDEFLRSRGLTTDPNTYSEKGIARLRQDPQFSQILEEAVRSGRSYFKQNGVNNISDTILEKRQVQYYGVYAGEGVAFEKLQERAMARKRIVVLNFEEMRVPQMALRGARGGLTVVTPIKSEEMVDYYRWEARQIAKRR